MFYSLPHIAHPFVDNLQCCATTTHHVSQKVPSNTTSSSNTMDLKNSCNLNMFWMNNWAIILATYGCDSVIK